MGAATARDGARAVGSTWPASAPGGEAAVERAQVAGIEDADRNTDRSITAALALGLFCIYALGACRTIYVGDSGELVAAVYTLGIPHPSGYPLYVLLGKLWTCLVPIGSIAFRMSLFSAACAALACALLYRLCRAEDLARPASALAALLAALSPSFWSQANIQRVYALDGLFVVLATAAAVRWHRTRADRDLTVAFLLCGLGATNHTFMAIYALALGLYLVSSDPAMLTKPSVLAKRTVCVFGGFAVGLLPYAYLPLRSAMNPRLDWGNPETLDGVLAVVLRRDFWERAWLETPFDLVTVGMDYVHSLGTETVWIGLVLAAVGLVVGLRSRAPVLLAVLVMLGNYAAMALHGSRSDIFIWHRYYIPSYLMVAWLAAHGWDALSRRLPAVATWSVLALPVALLATGYARFDRSRYRIAEDFADAVLESVPPGAHLIATDDNVLFVLIYLQLVEHMRPDVNLILQGVGKADLPPLRFDPDEEPLFFTHHPNWDLPALEIVPVGVAYRAWRRGRPLPPVTVPRQWLDGELDPEVPKDYLTENLLGHFHYTLGFTFEDRDWEQARRQFELAARAAPDNDVLFYNLGLVYARNGLFDDAIAAFERSDRINPRHLASASKPRAIDKLAEVRAEQARIAAVEASLRATHQMTASPASADEHAKMAELLAQAGEAVAARGHRIRALEAAGSGEPSP